MMKVRKYKDKFSEYNYYEKDGAEVRHGLCKYYYENGKLKCEYNWKNGKLINLKKDPKRFLHEAKRIEKIKELFLDYKNNYLTLAGFANGNGYPLKEAKNILKEGFALSRCKKCLGTGEVRTLLQNKKYETFNCNCKER